MPTRGCAAQIEQDAGGLAGRIARIVRGDGIIETQEKTGRQERKSAEMLCGTEEERIESEEMTGDGRVVVFVEWSVDGVEKGEIVRLLLPICM